VVELVVEGGVLAGEPAARVVVQTCLLAPLPALELALVPTAGLRQLRLEAGQPHPAVDAALADVELATGRALRVALREQRCQRPQLLPPGLRARALLLRGLAPLRSRPRRRGGRG